MEILFHNKNVIKKSLYMHFLLEQNQEIAKKDRYKIIYEGIINQDIIKSITFFLDNKLKNTSYPFRINKLVFHVSIELLQNISKYSDDKDAGKGIIIVGETYKGYYVSTGNVIKNEKIVSLKEKLEILNALDKETLNDLYNKQVSMGSYNNLAGAGLGFIDIYRKSEKKILFDFVNIDDNISFFAITALIIK